MKGILCFINNIFAWKKSDDWLSENGNMFQWW